MNSQAANPTDLVGHQEVMNFVMGKGPATPAVEAWRRQTMPFVINYLTQMHPQCVAPVLFAETMAAAAAAATGAYPMFMPTAPPPQQQVPPVAAAAPVPAVEEKPAVVNVSEEIVRLEGELQRARKILESGYKQFNCKECENIWWSNKKWTFCSNCKARTLPCKRSEVVGIGFYQCPCGKYWTTPKVRYTTSAICSKCESCDGDPCLPMFIGNEMLERSWLNKNGMERKLGHLRRQKRTEDSAAAKVVTAAAVAAVVDAGAPKKTMAEVVMATKCPVCSNSLSSSSDVCTICFPAKKD